MGVYLTSNAQYNAFDLRSPSIPERTSRPLHLRRDRLSIASIARIGVTSTASLPAEREASELPELNRSLSCCRKGERRNPVLRSRDSFALSVGRWQLTADKGRNSTDRSRRVIGDRHLSRNVRVHPGVAQPVSCKCATAVAM